MAWAKLSSGFGPACFKLCCAIRNMRFLEQKKSVLDNNPESYLPNLHRARIMKRYDSECDHDFENPFIQLIESYDHDLLNFRSTSSWVSINETNVALLDFPKTTFESNQKYLYRDLQDHSLFWYSIGSYEIKSACHYLNNSKAKSAFFEAQLLLKTSSLYKNLQERFFPGKSMNLLRMRIPSSHKPQGFNKSGYRCFFGYYTVKNYVSGKPELFELNEKDAVIYSSNAWGEGLPDPDYYFRNIFEYSFCCCKSGGRTMGACAHRMAGAMFLGAEDRTKFDKLKYKAIDASSFQPALEL